MSGEQWLRLGAAYHLGFALFHLGFWWLFRWNEALRRLGRVNRGIMQVLNLKLIYVFLIFAGLSWRHGPELLASAPGQVLVAAMAGFWLLRAGEQLLFFPPRHPASIALFVVFLAGGAIHLRALMGGGG